MNKSVALLVLFASIFAVIQWTNADPLTVVAGSNLRGPFFGRSYVSYSADPYPKFVAYGNFPWYTGYVRYAY